MNDHAESLLPTLHDYFGIRSQELELHQAGAFFTVRKNVAFHQSDLARKPVFRVPYPIGPTLTNGFTSVMQLVLPFLSAGAIHFADSFPCIEVLVRSPSGAALGVEIGECRQIQHLELSL
jgi:hypothetical protein